MTYDAIGNMLTKGAVKYTWTQGRKLSAVDNGKKIQYFYDHTGNRTKKVVDGVTTQFRMAGDLLVSERTGTEKNLWYRYDSAGNVIAVTYDSVFYTYVRNVQNDIIAMIDSKGNEVVRYTYDSWGKVEDITGDMAETLGKRNPFRYRGYYYDTETGMYYLKNRYYDPELRRFISADEMVILAVSPRLQKEKNLYVYCDNNPLTRTDIIGKFWVTTALVSFAVGKVGSVLISAAVGAVVNVVSCGIAAKVTGQSYTGTDMAVAAISGAVSSLSAVLPYAPYIGGAISGLHAGATAKNNGGTTLEVFSSGAASFWGTTCIGNLGAIAMGESLGNGVGACFGATFGTGGNLVSSAVGSGISKRKPAYDKTLHIYKPTGYRCIGGGVIYNGKTGKASHYKLYLSDSGIPFKMYC